MQILLNVYNVHGSLHRESRPKAGPQQEAFISWWQRNNQFVKGEGVVNDEVTKEVRVSLTRFVQIFWLQIPSLVIIMHSSPSTESTFHIGDLSPAVRKGGEKQSDLLASVILFKFLWLKIFNIPRGIFQGKHIQNPTMLMQSRSPQAYLHSCIIYPTYEGKPWECKAEETMALHSSSQSRIQHDRVK